MADKLMIIGTSRFHLEQIMGAALWSLGKQGNWIQIRHKLNREKFKRTLLTQFTKQIRSLNSTLFSCPK